MNVSVVIPAFNAEQYISKAIQSILNQTVPVREIIVVDDYSNDGTTGVVKELIKEYDCIKLLKQSNNQGASSARNRGIQEEIGDWILFLDADDECSPDLLAHYMKIMQLHTYANQLSVIYPAYQQIDEQSKPISEVLRGKRLSGNEGFCDILMRNPIISPSGVLVKKETLTNMKGFNTEIKYVEDVDLWVRLLNDNYIIEYIDAPLSFIRRHAENTTSSMSVSHQAEKMILNQYGLETIKEKLFNRDYSFEQNSLDYAQFLIRYEEWESCKELLNNLTIQLDSKHYITYCFLRSLCHVQAEEFESALEMYKNILAINPKHGASLNNIGIIYSIKGMKELATKTIKRALQSFPGYLDAQHNLALSEARSDEVVLYRFTLRELRPVLLSYSTE